MRVRVDDEIRSGDSGGEHRGCGGIGGWGNRDVLVFENYLLLGIFWIVGFAAAARLLSMSRALTSPN